MYGRAEMLTHAAEVSSKGLYEASTKPLEKLKA
jgi:hypothetical protein